MQSDQGPGTAFIQAIQRAAEKHNAHSACLHEGETDKAQWREVKTGRCRVRDFNTNTPDVNIQVQTLRRSHPTQLMLLEQTQTHMHCTHTLCCEGIQF